MDLLADTNTLLAHIPASPTSSSRRMLSQGVPSLRKDIALWSVKRITRSDAGMANFMSPGPEYLPSHPKEVQEPPGRLTFMTT